MADADFDLSLVATFDAKQVVAGAAQAEAAIEKVSQADKRSAAQQRESERAAKAAAKAEKERADAINAVRAAIDPAYSAQLKMNNLLADAQKLAREGAISKRELAQVERLHAEAMRGSATSAGQLRAGYSQLGFQIQDITQSLALGINPMVVFGQQAGQAASAIAMMGGTAGRAASFFAGPWGAAILGGVTVLGMLIPKLLQTDSALEDVTFSSYSLKDAQGILGSVLDLTTGKINTQNTALMALARAQILVARVQAQARLAERQSEVKSLQDRGLKVDGGFGGGLRITRRPEDARDAISRDVLSGKLGAGDAVQRLGNLRRAGLLTDDEFNAAAASVSGYALEAENIKVFDSAERMLNGSGTASDRGLLLTPKKAGGSKNGGGSKKSPSDELDKLKKFGADALEKIQRITEEFDAQPTLVDRVNQKTRELDALIADLEKRKPIGWQELVNDARRAKDVIQEALVRPFEEMREQAAQNVAVQKLLSQGRDTEAQALQKILTIERQLGPLTADQRAEVVGMVKAEAAVNEELKRRQELQNNYLDTTRTIRGELEAIFAGEGSFKNLFSAARRLQSKIFVEQIFGDGFRDLEKWIKEETGLKGSVDGLARETARGGEAAGRFADAVSAATAKLTGAGAPGSLEQKFDSEFGSSNGTGEIVVRANRKTLSGMTPEKYFDEVAKTLTKPIVVSLEELVGPKLAGILGDVLNGALSGMMQGGTAGGILGALQGVVGANTKLGKVLGDGIKGAGTGTQVAGLANAFGIKLSSTGAQIGGAIGGMLPIPGGNLIGAIAGGILGAVFHKAKYGNASFQNGVMNVNTNTSKLDATANSVGNDLSTGLDNIVQALGGTLGAFNVSLGQTDGKWRISTTGRTGELKSKYSDVKVFGEGDAAYKQALNAAIVDAISDGAVQGLSDAVSRALRSSTDIDKAVKEALKVKDLEALLKYGGNDFLKALDDFKAVADERVRLAKAYGLDLLKVEKLNADERTKLINDAIEQQVGSLKSLLEDLSFGALFEGSPAERRAKILAEISDAKADVDAGVTGAVDRLAQLERQLVETSRAAFGTAGTEYATDRAGAISTAEQIIAAETKRIEDAAASTAQQIALANETNDLLAQTNAKLDTLIGLGGGATLGAFAGSTITDWGYYSSLRDTAVPF